ncbi:hypothetical protein TEA_000603 [Camellia sinensis var. sinensis]|uniref:cyclin-dependent kinase n=1 Tax=Camellia sinensis var. sinensis TaxID=542762 RepID=A0A4S4ETY5_CAMSN|nr:hypothetical protein TEA_000603 [Camellia sinensis var. sinensis]
MTASHSLTLPRKLRKRGRKKNNNNNKINLRERVARNARKALTTGDREGTNKRAIEGREKTLKPVNWQYEMGEVIGCGAFGVVHKGLLLESKQTVAIKKMHPLDLHNGAPSTIMEEISLLKEMEHANIVKLLEAIPNTDKGSYMIFEYLDYDLEIFMKTFPKKSKNKQRIKVVNLRYMPPEILLGSHEYSTHVDVWSVGCIFAEMIDHQPLFDDLSDNDHLHKIFSIMGTPDATTWPGVTSLPDYRPDFPKQDPKNLAEYVPNLEPAGVDLLSEMLCMNPARRISALDALAHPYFKNDDGGGEEEEEEEDDYVVDDDDP